MRIKNTDELVRRADWHYEQDHIAQGHYGRALVNGEVEFSGCAIGCLAAPVGNEALREYLESDSYAPTDQVVGWNRAANGSYGLVRSLASQFGIPDVLMRWAETVFEGLPSDEAHEFVPKFARAVAACDGVEMSGLEGALAEAWSDVNEECEADVPGPLFAFLARQARRSASCARR